MVLKLLNQVVLCLLAEVGLGFAEKDNLALAELKTQIEDNVDQNNKRLFYVFAFEVIREAVYFLLKLREVALLDVALTQFHDSLLATL